MAEIQRILSSATAAQHAAVERTPCFEALMSPKASLADVKRALMAFADHYAVWEPAIHHALRPIVGDAFLGPRARIPALLADLSRMGEIPPGPPAQPVALGIYEALGCLYVHEGSSHGALVIRKSLSRALGSDVAESLSFFAGYGRRTTAMWAETLRLLDAEITTDVTLARAKAGAQRAFDAIRAAALARVEPAQNLM